MILDGIKKYKRDFSLSLFFSLIYDNSYYGFFIMSIFEKYSNNIEVSSEMFDYARMMIGNINVIEDHDQIRIEGIPGRDYSNDIFKIWRSSKIAGNLFTRIKSSSLAFHKFFAPEIIYTLQTALQQRKTEVNKRVLTKTIDELYLKTWLANTQKEFPNILDYSKLDDLMLHLLPHQMEFLNTYNSAIPKYNLNGYLLAAPPGAGKTINGLALMHCLRMDTVIIVSPNNAIYKVWKKTIETESVFKEPKKCWVSQDKKPFDSNISHYVFHYEALDEALALLDHHDCGEVGIILDECHNFNEVTSKRTEAFINLCKKSRSNNIVWASGTPIKAIGNEAIPLLRTIDPFFTERAEESFKAIFGKSAQKGLDILQHRMGLITFKVSKDVVRQQEKPIVIPVKVKLDRNVSERFTLDYIKQEMVDFVLERMIYYKQNMKHYEDEYNRCLNIHQSTLTTKEEENNFKTYNNYIKIISKDYDPVQHKAEALYCNKYEDEKIIPTLSNQDKHIFRDCKSVVKYVYLKVQGEALGRILGKRRAECNTELVKHAGLENIISDAAKKTVIFSSWVETIKEAEEYLINLGFKPTMVYGGTNKEVSSIVTKFEQNPDINPIIATFQSLSTAVPLTVANTVIMLNQPFRDHEWDQAVSRCDRLGQDTQVYVYEILLDTGTLPNISTRSKDILEWSKAQIELIMPELSKKTIEENIDDGYYKVKFKDDNNTLLNFAENGLKTFSNFSSKVLNNSILNKYFK